MMLLQAILQKLKTFGVPISTSGDSVTSMSSTIDDVKRSQKRISIDAQKCLTFSEYVFNDSKKAQEEQLLKLTGEVIQSVSKLHAVVNTMTQHRDFIKECLLKTFHVTTKYFQQWFSLFVLVLDECKFLTHGWVIR